MHINKYITRDLSNNSHGYALFDVLFAMSLLAIVISIAGYHKNNSQKSLFYSWRAQQALVIAEDIATRININSSQETNNGHSYIGTNIWKQSTFSCNKCQAIQQVKKDGKEVADMIDRTLINGGAQVDLCQQSLCIYVWWNKDRPVNGKCNECVNIKISP